MSCFVECAFCGAEHAMAATRIVRFGVSEDGYACPACAACLRELLCEGCGLSLNVLSDDPQYSCKRIDLRLGPMPTNLCASCRKMAEYQRQACRPA